MSKSRVPNPFTRDLLSKVSTAPKHRRLYFGLRDAILSGRVRSGVALPSTRTIARDLKLSRNTVVTAFDQLTAEGYIEGKVGAGSFVTANLVKALPERESHARSRDADAGEEMLSRRGRLLASQTIRAIASADGVRPFRSGTPALDEFPYALWARISAQCTRTAPASVLAYSDPAGFAPLRRAIAEYLAASRSVRCTPEQVVVTVGSQQALDLAARLVLDLGDAVWLEEPGYRGARAAFAGNGARIVPVPLDRDGLNLEAGRRFETRPRLIYVTPSCQFPTGVTMSLDRRLALLSFARQTGAWIFEDDYDSEFRYVGRPLAALQGLDEGSRVIYAGTFSKVLFPGLRLGYVVLPPALVDAFVAARTVADRNAPGLDQAVVARFLAEGHFASHLRRMRELYRERQLVLLAAATKHLVGTLHLEPQDAGMHLVGKLRAGRDDVDAAHRAAALRVDVVPLSAYYLRRPVERGLIMCYASSKPALIRDAVKKLKLALA